MGSIVKLQAISDTSVLGYLNFFSSLLLSEGYQAEQV